MEYRAMKSFNYTRAQSAIFSMCNIIVVRFLSLQNSNVGLSVWLSIQADIVQIVQNIRCYAYVLILEDMSNKFELKLSYRNFRSTNLSFISRVITLCPMLKILRKNAPKSWTVDLNIVNTLNQSYHIQLTGYYMYSDPFVRATKAYLSRRRKEITNSLEMILKIV